MFVDSFAGFAYVYALFGLSNAFWSGSDQAFIYDELKSVGREADAQKVFSRSSGIMAVGSVVFRVRARDVVVT